MEEFKKDYEKERNEDWVSYTTDSETERVDYNNSPVTPAIPDDSESGTTVDSGTTNTGGTENSGNTNTGTTTGTTGNEGGSTGPSSQFVISIQIKYDSETFIDYQYRDGWAGAAYSKIHDGIIFGDLIDYTSANITIRNKSGFSMTITDLTKTYNIPDGEYIADGWVGRQKRTNLSGAYVEYWNDWGWPRYETPWMPVLLFTVRDGVCFVALKWDDSLVFSDVPFSANTGAVPVPAFKYKDVYYMFVRNEYHDKGASWSAVVRSAVPTTFYFDSVSYTIDSFVDGGGWYFLTGGQ